MKVFYSEPFLSERIEKAKAKARFIKQAKNIETLDDAEMVLRMILSRHYNIPFFDEYFDKRSIDELFFEVELIKSDEPISPEQISGKMKEEKKEIDSIADDMEKWDSMPLEDGLEGDPFFNMAKEFMSSGEFTTEQEEKQKETQDDWK